MSEQDIGALERRLEANEVAAWRAMYQSPTPAVAARLGLGYAEQGGALLIWNRAAPTLLFNRILALGVTSRPTTRCSMCCWRAPRPKRAAA